MFQLWEVGDIIIINAQNPRNKGPETTQDKIWHKLAIVLHKAVVAAQWVTTGSYWTRIPLEAAPKTIASNITVSPSEEHLRFYSNGGHMDYIMRGTLDILPMVIYVNDNSMANTFSIKEVADYFRVTMDTKEDHVMLVQYCKDKDYRFKEYGKGQYYLDLSNPEIIPLTTEGGDTDYYFLSTVNKNMEYFTRAEIEGAYRARDLQHLLRWTYDKKLINFLSKNLIINFLVLLDNVRRANAVHGSATAILKGGGGLRKNPKHN